MHDLIERDNQPQIVRNGRFAGVVVVSALISVAFMRWLPMFVIFFTVPLFVAYFVFGKRSFVMSVFLAFAFDIAVSLIATYLTAHSLDGSAFMLSVCQSAFLFFPIFSLLIPGTMKARYRILFSGAISAGAWFFLLVATGTGSLMAQTLHEMTTETANMLYALVPEGYERTAFQAQLSPERLYTIMSQVLSYSFLPICVLLYAIGYIVASGISAIMRRSFATRFRAKFFYVDSVMFIPLVCAMAGVILGKMVRADFLVTVSWNALITTGLFFILQGWGILSFFLDYIRPKMNRFLYFLTMFGIIMLALEGWPFLLGALLIAGVVELFVPLRSRFGNKDIADPTPGNGNDHQ